MGWIGTPHAWSISRVLICLFFILQSRLRFAATVGAAGRLLPLSQEFVGALAGDSRPTVLLTCSGADFGLRPTTSGSGHYRFEC